MNCQLEPRKEDQGEGVKILGEDLEKLSSFKYLGSLVAEYGNMGMEIKLQMSSGWNR